MSNVGTIYRGMNRGIALREYDESVAISKGGILGRWHDEEVTLFEDDEILKEYDPSIQPAQPPAIESITDEERMDFLVMKIVDVRAELRYGSALMFTSQARYENDGTDTFTGTTLREQIDKAIIKERSEK